MQAGTVVHTHEYDITETEPVVAIATALAAAKDTERRGLNPPLQDAVDVDSVTRVLETAQAAHVSFLYDGLHVTVTPLEVRVKEPDV